MIWKKRHQYVDGDVVAGGKVVAHEGMDSHGPAHFCGDVTIRGELDVTHIKGARKGAFETLSQLESQYPHPHNGWYAFVGDRVYRAWAGAWKDAGMEWNPEYPNIPDGYIKEEQLSTSVQQRLVVVELPLGLLTLPTTLDETETVLAAFGVKNVGALKFLLDEYARVAKGGGRFVFKNVKLAQGAAVGTIAVQEIDATDGLRLVWTYAPDELSAQPVRTMLRVQIHGTSYADSRRVDVAMPDLLVGISDDYLHISSDWLGIKMMRYAWTMDGYSGKPFYVSLPGATSQGAGVMSEADKNKLDGLEPMNRTEINDILKQ